MGEVAIKYRIMPEDVDVDLDALNEAIKSSLPEEAAVNNIEKSPVAFGLVALDAMIVLDDKKGGAEVIEEILAGLEGVQNVEVLEMGLL